MHSWQTHYKQKSRFFGSQSRLRVSKQHNNALHAFCGIETIELPFRSSHKKSVFEPRPAPSHQKTLVFILFFISVTIQFMKRRIILALSLLLTFKLFAQDETIYLWRNVRGMEKEPSVMFAHKPKIENNRAAVIVCPGGSYYHLDLYAEGHTTAKWFAEQGFTAFVLRYRTNQSFYTEPSMLQDIQRAIQLVRENAETYDIDPNKVGIIGYSAGGHLVAMAGEFFETHNELKKIGIETNVSLRPDYVMPIYPVVSMQDDIAHRWSRNSLLGRSKKYQTQERKDEFSLELHVPDNMPPTYIVVAEDDPIVIPENAKRLYAALEAKKIPNCRIAIYEWGKHGFGMKNNNFMRTFHWNESLKEWLIEIGVIEK